MGMFIRYVEEARRTVVRAKHQADRFGSLEIEPEHIFLALLDDPVLVSRTMNGISTRAIIETIDARLPRREPNRQPHDLDLSTAAREALLLAEREADKLGHRDIRNWHLLLGLIESAHGFAAELMTKEGLSADQLRRQLESFSS
jgi:ATP-dependent Clp protease ATP-binding subunit ClpA